jgi:hypothetical protein
MKQMLYLLVCCLALAACDPVKQKVTDLEKETERIHDEAMVELAIMNRVGRQIKELIKGADLNPKQKNLYLDILNKMNKADKDMSTWMVNYKQPNQMESSSALIYLEEQKQLIDQNKRDIIEALNAGKAQLSKP